MSASTDTFRIGRVATLARVSVRALHHYDALGLLSPSGRSEAGYRLYTTGDLERLQQILFFRELGFALDDIRRIVLDPGFDRRRALLAQRALLAEKARRTQTMLTAIDTALTALDEGTTMDETQMFEGFGEFDPREYEAEARERWGESDAYRESARRTARYTADDWRQIKEEADAITAALVAALDGGLAPDDPAVQAAVGRHWRHLERWFYTPTPEMYAGLGDLYVNDPRFTKNIDKERAGLATFQREAMQTYARKRESETQEGS